MRVMPGLHNLLPLPYMLRLHSAKELLLSGRDVMEVLD